MSTSRFPTVPTSQAEQTPPAAKSTWLSSFLLRQNPRFLAHFVVHYRRLQQLPRRMRRKVARRAAVTITGAALLLAFGRLPVRANSIIVADGEVAIAENGVCSLIEAIQNANDRNTGMINADCTAGEPGSEDIIVLPTNGMFTLTEPFSIHQGSGTGLPFLTGFLIIEGNGYCVVHTGT